MRIVGYSRVSSREQAESSHALDQQIERLKAAGVGEIFSDVDSGSKDKRPAFNKVMELVKSRLVDEVVVTRIDRLTRSLPTLRRVLDAFRESGVNLRALDDSIDMGTAAGKFHLNMLGALAEMEVDRLSERVKHGWKHLRDRNVAMNPPFGYCKVNDKYQLDHAEFLCLLQNRQTLSRAQIAHNIIEIFFEKKTLRLTLRGVNERYGIRVTAHYQGTGGRVAREIFRFSPTGLKNWLVNPVLQGHTCYLKKVQGVRQSPSNWEVYYDTHPTERLLSDAQAQRIQEILTHNARVKGYGSTALKYPLSGLVFCGECRGACYSLTGSRGKNIPGQNYYFQCKNWRTRGCSQKSVIRMDVVEKAVIEELRSKADAIAAYALIPENPSEPPELQQLRAQLAGLEQLGINPALDEAKRQLRSQIDNFVHEQAVEETSSLSKKELLLTSLSVPDFWNSRDVESKKQYYQSLITRITVQEGKILNIKLKI